MPFLLSLVPALVCVHRRYLLQGVSRTKQYQIRLNANDFFYFLWELELELLFLLFSSEGKIRQPTILNPFLLQYPFSCLVHFDNNTSVGVNDFAGIGVTFIYSVGILTNVKKLFFCLASHQYWCQIMEKSQLWNISREPLRSRTWGGQETALSVLCS